jgi:hypothetical protein
METREFARASVRDILAFLPIILCPGGIQYANLAAKISKN